MRPGMRIARVGRHQPLLHREDQQLGGRHGARVSAIHAADPELQGVDRFPKRGRQPLPLLQTQPLHLVEQLIGVGQQLTASWLRPLGGDVEERAHGPAG